MDSARTVQVFAAWTLLLAWTTALPAVETAEKFLLTSHHRSGELARVEISLQVGGEVKLVADAKTKNLPMSVVARLKYDERVLAVDRQSRPVRSVRHYDEAQAAIKVDQGGEKPSLDPRHRRIVVDKPEKSAAVLYSPSEPLSREELDLVDIPGNTLVIDRLLPPRPVALGESWKLDDQTLADLLSLEAVSWTDVECMLGRAADGIAEVSAAGSVSGAVGGVSTEIELKVKYKYNLEAQRISFFAMLIKEKRSVGHVGPGLDTVAKLLLSTSALPSSDKLTDEAIGQIPQQPSSEQSELSYASPSGRFRFDYDRRWYLTTDDPKLAVWRLLDRGELVAQCNMSALSGGKKPVTLAEFQKDVQQSLGKNFGQFVKASQESSDAGYTVLRVVAHGSVSQLPIAWIYYLIQDANGQGVTVAFTFEQDLESRFAQADRALVSSLRLVEDSASTAAKAAKSR